MATKYNLKANRDQMVSPKSQTESRSYLNGYINAQHNNLYNGDYPLNACGLHGFYSIDTIEKARLALKVPNNSNEQDFIKNQIPKRYPILKKEK